MRKKTETEINAPKTKTAKARDWALSTIIRLPVILIVLAIILFALFIGTLIVSPDTAKMAIEYMKEIFK